MKLISCYGGKLHGLDASGVVAADARGQRKRDAVFRTRLDAIDSLAPGGALARGAVHELITTSSVETKPMMFAAWLARCSGDAAVVWSDPDRELYPPAIAALGIPLKRLYLLHPTSAADHVWAVAECLRCKGVSAVVAAIPETNSRQRLTRVQARRLQLAAEQGGGVGVLLRRVPPGKSPADAEHAAVTRWLVEPSRGERNVQRWRIQLLFGHGGRVGEPVILEHHRDPIATRTSIETTQPAATAAGPFQAYPLRPAAELADRPALPTPQRSTA
jgi:protein ImuA